MPQREREAGSAGQAQAAKPSSVDTRQREPTQSDPLRSGWPIGRSPRDGDPGALQLLRGLAVAPAGQRELALRQMQRTLGNATVQRLVAFGTAGRRKRAGPGTPGPRRARQPSAGRCALRDGRRAAGRPLGREGARRPGSAGASAPSRPPRARASSSRPASTRRRRPRGAPRARPRAGPRRPAARGPRPPPRRRRRRDRRGPAPRGRGRRGRKAGRVAARPRRGGPGAGPGARPAPVSVGGRQPVQRVKDYRMEEAKEMPTSPSAASRRPSPGRVRQAGGSCPAHHRDHGDER